MYLIIFLRNKHIKRHCINKIGLGVESYNRNIENIKYHKNMYKKVKVKKSGGKRHGAGAKKKTDKKIQVTFYIEQSIINKVGGLKNAKQGCYEHLFFCTT